mgnify:CR=1 FL=1
MDKNKQIRLTSTEYRAESSEDKTYFVGYASVFNRTTDLGYFVESIHPDAFNQALSRGDDTRALFNHDPNLILARSTSGTLKMSVDEVGLRTEIEMPETTLGRDLKVLIERGDISQMSFGFYIEKEEKRGIVNEKPWYEIQQVRLFDVSPVTFPAYEQTSIEVKRCLEEREKHIRNLEQLEIAKLELRTRQVNYLKIS